MPTKPKVKQDRASRAGPLGNFDLDESPDAPSVSEQIIAALSRNAGKVLDLFRSWDNNADGVVTRKEFHRAMSALGLEVPKASIDEIFTGWDKDGGGQISLHELTGILRQAAATRKNVEKMGNVLVKKGLRVSGLFREWDFDSSGEISKDEFREAMKDFGLALSVDQYDAIFESLDRDNSGSLNFRELNKALRRDVNAEKERKAREEAERVARELANRVEIVDLNALKSEVRKKLRADKLEREQKAIELAAQKEREKAGIFPTMPIEERMAKKTSRPRWSRDEVVKSKAEERAHHHLYLRLRGTELSTSHQPLDEENPARSVTRHGRLPTLEPGRSESMPKLIDVLSTYRRRSHVPARRHCHVLLPETKSRLSARRVAELQQSSTELALRRHYKRLAAARDESFSPTASMIGSKSEPLLPIAARTPLRESYALY